MFTCDKIGADVGFFLKGLERKIAPSCLVVTLGLVDGKTATQEFRGNHILLNPQLSNWMLEACRKFALLIRIG
jgi:hypothetical protein